MASQLRVLDPSARLQFILRRPTSPGWQEQPRSMVCVGEFDTCAARS